MKTSIKKYYTEPQVESARIMCHVLKSFGKPAFSELYLISLIALGGLLLVFFIFLLLLNLSFFSVAWSLYFIIGNSIFIFCNLLIGVFIFTMEYHVWLVSFLCMVVGVEA